MRLITILSYIFKKHIPISSIFIVHYITIYVYIRYYRINFVKNRYAAQQIQR